MHNHRNFFLTPNNPIQKRYEALRAFYVDQLAPSEIAQRFGWSKKYFNKIKSQFHQALLREHPPQFFIEKIPGAKPVEIEGEVKKNIIALRSKSYSILDIQAVLNAQEIQISLRQIEKVLKASGFPRLPKRTHLEKHQVQLPQKLEPPRAVQLNLVSQPARQITTRYGGIFFFLPFIKALNLPQIIQHANYPETTQLTSQNYIFSLLLLKLLAKERLSSIDNFSLDAGAGLFARLNVLPKSSAVSSYSYKTDRQMNQQFLKGLYQAVQMLYPFSGDINLDFTAIPHWGDHSVLERNWNGSRNKALKSVLALIALDQETGFIPYGNTEITHRDKDEAVLQFIDFWKETSNQSLKCLIFDSKFTTYNNLSRINRDGVKFITLRRRGNTLIHQAHKLPKNTWNSLKLDSISRKHQNLKVSESRIRLKDSEGTLRQLVLTGHGRQTPTFIITNDFHLTQKEIVTKYARRALVEKSISEQIYFFPLNSLSSSIVIKVDLDLTMTITAHTLYRMMAKTLTGFEHAEAKTLFRHFIDTNADIAIDYPTIDIKVLKKVHYPILFEEQMFKKTHTIPWLNNAQLKFSIKNTT